MRFSDIKVGYIYNVIFDPVRNCEFNEKHLAVVLKRNNDKSTYIVMPLTSAPNGVGVNKIKIGAMNCLPTSLKSNETYAVFNQIRTVNADRFIALKEGGMIKDCEMGKDIFHNLLFLGLREIVYGLSQDDRIEVLKYTYETELVAKAKDILSGVHYFLEQQFLKDGIDKIFEEAKNI